MGRIKYHTELIKLRGDTGDKIGTFAGDVALGLRGWFWGRFFWREWDGRIMI